METFGERLKRLRLARNWTRADLVQKLQGKTGHAASLNAYAQWERGCFYPSMHYLRQLAALLQISLDELVG